MFGGKGLERTHGLPVIAELAVVVVLDDQSADLGSPVHDLPAPRWRQRDTERELMRWRQQRRARAGPSQTAGARRRQARAQTSPAQTSPAQTSPVQTSPAQTSQCRRAQRQRGHVGTQIVDRQPREPHPGGRRDPPVA